MTPMTQATKDHLADVRRNTRDELHDARLADGLAKHAASMRRGRRRVESLRCGWFIAKYGSDGWREAMAAAREART